MKDTFREIRSRMDELELQLRQELAAKQEEFRYTVEKKKVRAIGIHLLVKARKTTEEASPGPFDSVALGQSDLSFEPVGGEQHRSYVLFQRIVPVVNNGI